MSDDLAIVLINLKACLLSVKGGIPLNQLDNDYAKLNGPRIPFKNLGFSSLEELLNSTGKFIIQNRGGVRVVQALGDDKTQHLTELISKQKSKPPKKNPYMGSKFAPRKFNTSSTYNKPNNYSRRGDKSLSYRPPLSKNIQGPTTNYNNLHKTSASSHKNTKFNQTNTQQKSYDQNNYNKELQQNNFFYDTKNDVKSAATTNGSHPSNVNGKSYTKPEQKLPLTSSCSSLESTYSSSSASYTYKSTSIKSLDKFQKTSLVNNTAPQTVSVKDKTRIPITSSNNPEKLNELKPLIPQHISTANIPSLQNMPKQVSTAQSRLQKYPKKCDDYKVDGKEKKIPIEDLSVQDSKIDDDPCLEVIDNKDYINELEIYLKNLNLLEPFYECMIKKEKSGKTIKHTHICTIKVNDKSVGSSFPVECSSVDNAKNVAAKHALTVLKKQYGESVIYPITNDINTMASRIKEFLKTGYEGTGVMGDILERMYREKFQENLPDNWVQLLEVYSYFTFDKLIENTIIIYLNEIETPHKDSENTNGYLENTVEEEYIVPGTPLMLENYDEKSVLVSANYGSTYIWIRFVGQSADENFIKMQAKFNDIMNTAGFNIAKEVIVGEFYAVLYNSSWHRVQISYITDDGIALCFMVDTGEQLDISQDQLCTLEPVFMRTKTQAIKCVLTQLDNFGDFYGLKELLDEMILNKTFFLVPDSLEDGIARVTLYEKGEASSDRVNVNDMIIQRFLDSTIARLPPFEDNAVVDATVSSYVSSGHLNLQLNTDVVASLEDILPNDELLTFEFFLKSKDDLEIGQVYLIKYDETIWSRVEVLEIISDSEVKIIYIDYGNVGTCQITQLANLNLYDPLMTKIAPQAIKVSMHLLPPNTMTEDIAKKIYAIGTDKVLVNVINAPSNDVPCVQLYKTQPETPEIPLCINVQLAQSLKNNKSTMS